jgi:hypothetical protein
MSRPSSRHERYHAACHEAGHGVAAIVMGWPFRYVTLGPRRADAIGQVLWAPNAWRVTRSGRWEPELVVYAAGPAAEDLAVGGDPERRRDIARRNASTVRADLQMLRVGCRHVWHHVHTPEHYPGDGELRPSGGPDLDGRRRRRPRLASRRGAGLGTLAGHPGGRRRTPGVLPGPDPGGSAPHRGQHARDDCRRGRGVGRGADRRRPGVLARAVLAAGVAAVPAERDPGLPPQGRRPTCAERALSGTGWSSRRRSTRLRRAGGPLWASAEMPDGAGAAPTTAAGCAAAGDLPARRRVQPEQRSAPPGQSVPRAIALRPSLDPRPPRSPGRLWWSARKYHRGKQMV